MSPSAPCERSLDLYPATAIFPMAPDDELADLARRHQAILHASGSVFCVSRPFHGEMTRQLWVESAGMVPQIVTVTRATTAPR
jgi:hypothetical protein